MNRIFKISSLVVVALVAMFGCTNDLLYMSTDPVVSGSRSVPLGSIRFQTGQQSRGESITKENLSAVEATAYTNIEKNDFRFEKYLFKKTGKMEP